MRKLVLLSVLLIVATLMPGRVRAGAAPAAERPNVVLIISDDQGWGDFGFMGHEVIRTPNLDRLAADSAVFPNGYVPTSLCRASLASLMTGLYGTQHKICCNDFPTEKDRSATHPFIKSVPTVPRLLAEAGYASLQTGKFWEGHYSNAGFTDGMTDARDRFDHRFGEQAVLDVVAANQSAPPKVILEHVLTKLQQHMGDVMRRDDLTMVIARS